VIKKDGSKELYDRTKLKRAIMLAFAKRDLSQESIDEMLFRLESKWSAEGKEIESKKIGDDVLQELKDVDQVAYVRFASVYKKFDSIEDFQEFIGCKVE
jgi:transcriptional repressor NrdR